MSCATSPRRCGGRHPPPQVSLPPAPPATAIGQPGVSRQCPVDRGGRPRHRPQWHCRSRPDEGRLYAAGRREAADGYHGVIRRSGNRVARHTHDSRRHRLRRGDQRRRRAHVGHPAGLVGGSGSAGRASRARIAAQTFIEEALGPNDQVAIINVHGTMGTAQAFTRNRTLLLDAIDRLDKENPKPFNTTRTAYQVLEDVGNGLGRMVGRRLCSSSIRRRSSASKDRRASARTGGRRCRTMHRTTCISATRWRRPRETTWQYSVVATDGIAGASPDRPVNETGVRPKIRANRRTACARTTGAQGGDAIRVQYQTTLSGRLSALRPRQRPGPTCLATPPEVEHRDGDFHRLTVRVNRPPANHRRTEKRVLAAGRERPPARPGQFREERTEREELTSRAGSAADAAVDQPLRRQPVCGALPRQRKRRVRAHGPPGARPGPGARYAGEDRGWLHRHECRRQDVTGCLSHGHAQSHRRTRQIVERSGLPFVESVAAEGWASPGQVRCPSAERQDRDGRGRYRRSGLQQGAALR